MTSGAEDEEFKRLQKQLVEIVVDGVLEREDVGLSDKLTGAIAAQCRDSVTAEIDGLKTDLTDHATSVTERMLERLDERAKALLEAQAETLAGMIASTINRLAAEQGPPAVIPPLAELEPNSDGGQGTGHKLAAKLRAGAGKGEEDEVEVEEQKEREEQNEQAKPSRHGGFLERHRKIILLSVALAVVIALGTAGFYFRGQLAGYLSGESETAAEAPEPTVPAAAGTTPSAEPTQSDSSEPAPSETA